MSEFKKEKPEYQYRVYGTDTDGSERLMTTVYAKSTGHAFDIARKSGHKQLTAAVKI